jgi:hypothetical protein
MLNVFLVLRMVSHMISTMFPKHHKKVTILELSRRVNINYLGQSLRRTEPSAGIVKYRTGIGLYAQDEGLDYLSAPLFASGRVIVASLLGKLP